MTMYLKSRDAVTDVAEMIASLEGGKLESMLSVAVSKTAAKVIEHSRKGEVTFKLVLEQIDGTTQVRIEHTVSFTRPTGDSKHDEATDKAGGATVMHVGPNGALTLLPPHVDYAGQSSLSLSPSKDSK